MKHGWDKLRLLAAGLAMAVLFTGCGAGSGSDNMASSMSVTSSAAMEETGEMAMDTLAANDLDTGAVDPETMENSGRKIIYTAYAAMETENYDETSAAVRQMVDEAGGYISSSSARGNRADGSRSVDYTCKIPAENYSSFIDGLSGAGNLYRLSESTDDVTIQYVDLDARLRSLENQLERLEALAEEAADIDTLLTIETKIGDVQYELESYTAQMRTLENQIAYSTIDLTIDEVGAVSEGTGFGSRLRAAFGDGWDGFVSAVQGIAVAVVTMLPWLVVLAVLLAVLIPVIRRRKKRAGRPAPGSTGRQSGVWQTGEAVKEPEKTEQPPEKNGQD